MAEEKKDVMEEVLEELEDDAAEAKKAEDAERNADVQVLKRKAKQLQYLLEEQSEEAEK